MLLCWIINRDSACTCIAINVYPNIKIFVDCYALKNIFISGLASARLHWKKVSSTRKTGTKLLWSDFRQPCCDGTCNLELSSKQGWYSFDARPPKQSWVTLPTTNEMYSFALTFAKSNNGHAHARVISVQGKSKSRNGITRFVERRKKDDWLCDYYLQKSCCHLVTSLVRRRH